MPTKPRKISKNAQRDSQILAILEENGTCTVHELCDKLYLSEATMRRSLSELARKGLINRTHGGAELLKTFSSASPLPTSPTTECIFVVSRASRNVIGGIIVGNRFASIVLPLPGLPHMSRL